MLVLLLLGDELLGKLRKGAAAGLALHDVGHLLADLSDLRAAGVCGLLDLVGASLGEGNAEQTEEVVIGGLDDDVGLDQGLPLADERAELVGGEVETVEVGQAVLALNLIDSQADLAEGVVLILLEIGERNLEDTALKSVVGVLETGGTVDEGLANTCGVLVKIFSCRPVAGANRIGEKTYSLMAKVEGALRLYQSFLAKL